MKSTTKVNLQHRSGIARGSYIFVRCFASLPARLPLAAGRKSPLTAPSLTLDILRVS